MKSYPLPNLTAKRTILCLAILAVGLMLTGEPSTAQAANEPAAARMAWLYNRGSFKMTQRNLWTEKNPTGEFHFREVARTVGFVELHDASRKISVRLYGSTMYWTRDQKGWNYLYHGRWEDANKRPLNEDRGGKDRAGLETAELRKTFPHLGRDYELLSPATKNYNCIAWWIGVTNKWVWPGEKVADFDRLYGTNGYQRIGVLDYSRKAGLDKIVLYGKRKGDGAWAATHGARQLADGSWSSKLGALPLIRHLEPGDVDGDCYGIPIAVYVRTQRR